VIYKQTHINDLFIAFSITSYSKRNLGQIVWTLLEKYFTGQQPNKSARAPKQTAV